MPFSTLYKKLKPSVVAIVGRISSRPDFPDIIGTGFIAGEDGIVVTNNHVIKAIEKLPRKKGASDDEWPIWILYLQDMGEKGMGMIFLEVEGVGTLGREKPIEGYHYGEEIPDIGIIYVKAKGLPFLEVEDSFGANEGEEVFISGFPMGTKTLRAPGWIHQISPVLQRGIISAIQPFPCDKPHGLLIEAMTQGGSSGSPIFNSQTGKVTALLYGGIMEWDAIRVSKEVALPYRNNTALTTAIPAYLVSDILKMAANPRDMGRDTSKHRTLQQIIEETPQAIHAPKTNAPGAEVIPPSDIEFPTTR
jgi:S1-C subfamily serine protease